MRSDVTRESHVVCSIQSLTPCNPYCSTISLTHCTIKSKALVYLSQNYKINFYRSKIFFLKFVVFLFREGSLYDRLYIYRRIKQNRMQGWHYDQGLIYYRPIFRLTKLAFLGARAIPRENIF